MINVPTQDEATTYLDLVNAGGLEISGRLSGVLYIISLGEYTDESLPEDIREEYNALIDTLSLVLMGILEETSSKEGMEKHIQKTIKNFPQADAYSFWVLDNFSTKWPTKEALAGRLGTISEDNSFSDNLEDATDNCSLSMVLQIREGDVMELLMRVQREDSEGDMMNTDVHVSGGESIREILEGILQKPIKRDETLWYQDDSVDVRLIKHAIHAPDLSVQIGQKGNKLGALLVNLISGELTQDEETTALGLLNAKTERKTLINESFNLWCPRKTQSFMSDGRIGEGFEIYFMDDFDVMSPKGTVFNAQSDLFKEMIQFVDKRRNKGLMPLIFDENEVIVNCTGTVKSKDCYEIYIAFEGLFGYDFEVNYKDFHEFLLLVCDTNHPIEDSVIFYDPDEGPGYSVYDEED